MDVSIEFLIFGDNTNAFFRCAGPQIILSVYCDMQLAGYGRLHVPLQAGVHQLRAHLSKPIASSLFGYIGSFFGYQPELVRPTMIATTAGSNRMLFCALYCQLKFN